MKKPLHWFICQLHGVELLLRHLFQFYDGPTTGPTSYSGPISKALKTCETLAVVPYDAIEAEVPQFDISDLSQDQKYLLRISQAVVTGVCPPDLSSLKPGPVCHSRWLTTANRLLRLYVGTENPSEKLVSLVNFVLKVYVPIWFRIKKFSKCYDGASHVWSVISLSRCLEQSVKDVIDPVIQRNSYFAHPENILLAMSVDERLDVRIDALNKILKCRNEKTSRVRDFKLQPLKFDAEDYTHLITWNEVSEPPLFQSIPTHILSTLILERTDELKKLLDFPCHTQAVERHVKLMTRAAKLRCSAGARDSNVFNTLAHRKIMPFFETKKDYKVQNLNL